MTKQDFYNPHEAYRQLTNFMTRWRPDIDELYLMRMVEQQFKLYMNSSRKEDFVSYAEWRLIIQDLKESANEFMIWEAAQAEEEIPQDAPNRAHRIQQWREHVTWKYDIFWEQFRNPQDLTIKRNK